MYINAVSLNPFSLLMEPEVVLQAMERSSTLRGLHRKLFRPLDKPLIPYAKSHTSVIDFDMEIDQAEDEFEYELND
jgi:hypothetical protein